MSDDPGDGSIHDAKWSSADLTTLLAVHRAERVAAGEPAALVYATRNDVGRFMTWLSNRSSPRPLADRLAEDPTIGQDLPWPPLERGTRQGQPELERFPGNIWSRCACAYCGEHLVRDEWVLRATGAVSGSGSLEGGYTIPVWAHLVCSMREEDRKDAVPVRKRDAFGTSPRRSSRVPKEIPWEVLSRRRRAQTTIATERLRQLVALEAEHDGYLAGLRQLAEIQAKRALLRGGYQRPASAEDRGYSQALRDFTEFIREAPKDDSDIPDDADPDGQKSRDGGGPGVSTVSVRRLKVLEKKEIAGRAAVSAVQRIQAVAAGRSLTRGSESDPAFWQGYLDAVDDLMTSKANWLRSLPTTTAG